jgi:hypothetical protein
MATGTAGGRIFSALKDTEVNHTRLSCSSGDVLPQREVRILSHAGKTRESTVRSRR